MFGLAMVLGPAMVLVLVELKCREVKGMRTRCWMDVGRLGFLGRMG